jgi:hypothetical protein
MDPHSFLKLAPDQHSPKKLDQDPDPYKDNAEMKHCLPECLLKHLWKRKEIISRFFFQTHCTNKISLDGFPLLNSIVS